MLFCTLSLFCQNEEYLKNQSPYFHVKTGGIDLDHFPLLSSSADVQIAGPIADVSINQIYKNDCDTPIEALYVFPASTRAAVYEMTMYVGGRIIKAEIQEKNKAKKTYEKAKKEGKRASLLEQHRPNVFQMNVANILPGDEVRVELKYNEFLVPENRMYSFIYPTVVGPRFADKAHANQDSKFVSNPYGKEGEDPSYDFDIRLSLNAGMPIEKSFCKSHKVNINYKNATSAEVSLKQSEKHGGNRDFIFDFSLSGDQIAEGTFLYDHGDEKFFLTMVQPPSNISEVEIPAREYIFVMDVSGSMRGFPISVSKNLMKDLVANLRPTDKFNIMLFAGGSQLMSQISIAATQLNLMKAFNFIDSPQGGGSTRLLPALQKAIDLPTAEEINSRSIVVITDGYVHVERETFKLISQNLNKSNLFAFGIGSSVNRHLIEGMAHSGRGEAFVVTDQQYAKKEATKFRKYIQTPLLTNINVQYSGFDTYDVIPFSFPDLLAERPLFIFGKYKGRAKGSIKITGSQGNKKYSNDIRIHENLVNGQNSPIRYLWAREKIRWLNDLNGLSTSTDDVKELTQLGLDYNLLTKYTSFVAVDQVSIKDLASQSGQAQKANRVKQVLPMPQGVSNHAIGFSLKVDGVSKYNDSSSKKCFVFITGQADASFKTRLKRLIENLVEFTDEERRMLSGNTITIVFDPIKKHWKILDNRGKLGQGFAKDFEKILNSVNKKNRAVNVKINLLWV